jgi:F420-0:gamma-glutamyl ligase-like protein
MVSLPNEGKNLSITVEGVAFNRIPITTHTITPVDIVTDVVVKYAATHLLPGDVLFVTEKIVSICQGRSIEPSAVKPRRLAHFLSSYVQKTPHGIGLGMPETMEMALREVGTPRILIAAAVAAVTKAFGRKGDFYRIAGAGARAIDGPTDGTLPPYNERIVLAPLKPKAVAESIKEFLHPTIDVLVVDINDLGGNILGSTLPTRENQRWVKVLADNPLGQGRQSTPLGIIRLVTND